MKNRIFSFIETIGVTPTEFADRIGVSRASISSIKTGRTQPTLMLVEKIKENFPAINVNWLIFGIGEMLETETTCLKNDKENDKDLFSFDNKIDVVNEIQSDIINKDIVLEEKQCSSKEITNSDKKKSDENKVEKKTIEELCDKTIRKIILLYDDGSFEEFNK